MMFSVSWLSVGWFGFSFLARFNGWSLWLLSPDSGSAVWRSSFSDLGFAGSLSVWFGDLLLFNGFLTDLVLLFCWVWSVVVSFWWLHLGLFCPYLSRLFLSFLDLLGLWKFWDFSVHRVSWGLLVSGGYLGTLLIESAWDSRLLVRVGGLPAASTWSDLGLFRPHVGLFL